MQNLRDRISELTDDILGHILSSIPTKDALRTSILSRRWKNVWTFVHVIDIQDGSILHGDMGSRRLLDLKVCFMNFVERVLKVRSLNEVSCLRKLHLSWCNDYDLWRVRGWLNVVTRLDNIEELDLKFSADQPVKLPLSIFTCKKLVVLKLTKNVILNAPLLVCLPNLKDLHLVSVTALDNDSVNNLLAGCPVLEELYLQRSLNDKMKKKTLYVRSTALKSLTVRSESASCISEFGYLARMVIDASNLERLDLALHVEEQIGVSNLSSLVRVQLDLNNKNPYTKLTQVHGIRTLELLRKMSNTKYLYLSSAALESLEPGRLNNLPMFENLTHLNVGNCYCIWPILPCFIESSPNLISLVLREDTLLARYVCQLQSHIPKCLMLNLEKIELAMVHGCKNQMELVSYFLKNAPVLKKMSITFAFITPEMVLCLHDKIIALPKASTACEIETTVDHFIQKKN